MDSALHFVLGQASLLGGAYLLSKSFPWTVAVGVVLVAEGVISVVYGMVGERGDKAGKSWHSPE